MFHHVKELQYNARVSEPDPRFAGLLLEQFGGPNGELSACMQYFVQAFAARQPFPEKYDMLMDIAAEELSHLEILGATIQMLLNGINGELKDAANNVDWMNVINDKDKRDDMVHAVSQNPGFFVNSGGGPMLTDASGTPWNSGYIAANGDLTVDLRSDMAAESRAKIVYEYLMQYTDDPYVKETLNFLMTREIAHYRMFEAALDTIEDNFPPGVLEGDPRYTHRYYNMSNGADSRGPWNEGQGSWPKGEEWVYIEDPLEQVVSSTGQSDLDKGDTDGASTTLDDARKSNKERSELRSKQVKSKTPEGSNQWSNYPQDKLKSPQAAE